MNGLNEHLARFSIKFVLKILLKPNFFIAIPEGVDLIYWVRKVLPLSGDCFIKQ